MNKNTKAKASIPPMTMVQAALLFNRIVRRYPQKYRRAADPIARTMRKYAGKPRIMKQVTIQMNYEIQFE